MTKAEKKAQRKAEAAAKAAQGKGAPEAASVRLEEPKSVTVSVVDGLAGLGVKKEVAHKWLAWLTNDVHGRGPKSKGQMVCDLPELAGWKQAHPEAWEFEVLKLWFEMFGPSENGGKFSDWKTALAKKAPAVKAEAPVVEVEEPASVE